MRDPPLDLGSRRELFVDNYLIDTLRGTLLKLHQPQPSGVAVTFDQPWEDNICAYTTVLVDGDTYRMYYRALMGRFTGYAESSDGVVWTKPDLELVEWDGSTANNILLQGAHTFVPFLDTRPEVAAEERFKANAVERDRPDGGLIGYVSADGIHWRRLRDKPIVPITAENAFDSQNVMFWSDVEQRYLLYARHMEGGRRATMRAASCDFREWSEPTFMTYGDTGTSTPSAHLYTNQTQPYFRAPHIYLALSARIFFADTKHIQREDDVAAAGKRVVAPELREFYARNVDERFKNAPGDHSDAVLLSSRAGSGRYDFTFRESLVRPGCGLENWTTRNNYPACGIVQTSPTEISFYLHRHYGQRTAHLERMALRLDGFVSVNAPYADGEMQTKALTFSGRELEINYATSAAGGVRVELQHADGMAVAGHSLAECVEMNGDRIDQIVHWSGGSSLEKLRQIPIRMVFAMKDADLYSLRFRS